MPLRTADDYPRYDASVQRPVKNIYLRDPVLIPQPFVDAVVPWYRRPAAIVAAVMIVVALAAWGILVSYNGVDGTLQLLARIAGGGMRTFAKIVGG